ncbi:hypothetical protein [Klebsiella michiganensis]|uniref:hypothetical protein n=1 Tax=Klebsiella michiganensis TaxID=1134687 RepID=UPI000D64D694|nr:hypothetical protein [Klebsiella michiganensis]MDL4446325.1 hypothetical protein [Klebsiella michiganensis]MDL4490879.1 hypothetical protein [Klebsiella michiganensis]MDL4659622.1 hypothetical protein [Klebsiella michiganensis]
MATSEKYHNLIKFLGFAGVATIFGIALSFGRAQQVIDDTSALAKQDQKQIEALTADIKVEQQEINDVDRRVTRLEDDK